MHRFTARHKFAFVIFRKPYYLNKYIGPSSNIPLPIVWAFLKKFKTLRSGNSYDSRTQPIMSTHGDENTGEAETGMIEGTEKNNMRFSPDLVDERIKASLEPLQAQNSALPEMMNRFIQSISAKESTTVSSRGFGHQYESTYSERPGSSKFPTVAPLTTTDTCPTTIIFRNGISQDLFNSRQAKLNIDGIYYVPRSYFFQKFWTSHFILIFSLRISTQKLFDYFVTRISYHYVIKFAHAFPYRNFVFCWEVL